MNTDSQDIFSRPQKLPGYLQAHNSALDRAHRPGKPGDPARRHVGPGQLHSVKVDNDSIVVNCIENGQVDLSRAVELEGLAAENTEIVALHVGQLGQVVSIPVADPGRAGRPSRICLLYTSPSPRDKRQSRMPSSA